MVLDPTTAMKMLNWLDASLKAVLKMYEHQGVSIPGLTPAEGDDAGTEGEEAG